MNKNLVRLAWFFAIVILLFIHPLAGAVLGAGYLIALALCYAAMKGERQQ